MLNILQAKLQQNVNHELPDVQAGFRKGRGARDQIASIRWLIEKAREFQKNIHFCFIDYVKAFDCGSQQTVGNSERDGNTRPPDLPPEKSICMSLTRVPPDLTMAERPGGPAWGWGAVGETLTSGGSVLACGGE